MAGIEEVPSLPVLPDTPHTAYLPPHLMITLSSSSSASLLLEGRLLKEGTTDIMGLKEY